MINRRVESQVESGLPARKVDRQQQQDFYSSTFPANTTSVATTATLPISTIDLPVASYYYCHDSLALNPGSVYPATTTASNSTPPAKLTLAISSYLSHLISDLSREFGDISHSSSNRTQTHNLWHQTHLPDTEFAQVMYQARELTRRHAVLRPGEVPPPPGQPRNRMPYFFACLRDLLGLRGEENSNKSSPKLRKTSNNLRVNDQRLNLSLSANQRYPSAAPSQEEACWQHEAEYEPQGDAQLENAAYSTQSKLSYKSGSHWREAQTFNADADAETDSTTRRRSGFALADSPLPASSGSIPPVLLNFPERREITHSGAGTTMVAHSPSSNRGNSYWNGQTAEGDGAEDEPNEFTTDHTRLEIVPNFKQGNAPNSVGDRAVPDRPLFGGAEARSRERYLAKYGLHGFPAYSNVSQAETNIAT